MREIVFDTETTGLDPASGDRLVEIGCVELLNHIPTGRTFHEYINPERPMSAGAQAVHGLGDDFLKEKPVFTQVAAAFLDFTAHSKLVAHNASFDRGFINMELERDGHDPLPASQFTDTLALARRRHPGGSNSLDALCSRFGIDNSARDKHGALLDAEILAEVYIELLGGRQASLALRAQTTAAERAGKTAAALQRPHPLPRRLTQEMRDRHAQFIDTFPVTALWKTHNRDAD
ncbi:MAG: DNA polymerase III subunit epsilon [Alphaproteobacteria bacterium]